MMTYVEVAFFENGLHGRYRGVEKRVYPGDPNAIIPGILHMLDALGRELSPKSTLLYHWLGAEAEVA